MALVDPSWRVKSRPCLFYQQGKCLFGDSCNFLHGAVPDSNPSNELPVAVGSSTLHLPPSLVVDSPRLSIRSPPRSPRTTSLLLALRDVIGDPDDEETNSDGVIHSSISHGNADTWSDSLPTLVNESDFGEFSQPGEDLLTDSSVAEEDDEFLGNWTAISDYNDDTTSQSLVSQNGEPISSVSNGRPDSGDASSEYETLQTNHTLGHYSDAPLSTEPASYSRDEEEESSIRSSASGLLSPIALSTLNFGPFFQAANLSRSTNSFDSGYADNWKPPFPMQPSPPRSPSISSTFDLLSSPFGSHLTRVISPRRLGALIGRSSPARTVSSLTQEDVEPLDLGLDSPSDYHINQQSASRLEDSGDEVADNDGINHESLLAELATEQPDSSDSDDEDEEVDSPLGLDSPSDYHNNQQSASRLEDPGDEVADNDGINHDSLLAELAIEQPDSSGSDDEDEEVDYPLAHTSIRSPERDSTMVSTGMPARLLCADVDDAIQREGSPPSHFLKSTDFQFQVGEVMENSSLHTNPSPLENGDGTPSSDLVSKESEEDHNSDNDTTFLAYLSSPGIPLTGNDTLNSLYDAYSETHLKENSTSVSFPTGNISPSGPEPSSLSNPSTPDSSLRERVFTPPPVTGERSGTVTAESPNSSSPMTSLDSVSRGPASSFSVENKKLPPSGSGRHSPYGQELEVSRKVPFGFKAGFSLGRASRSSLMTSRHGGKSVPPSPLKTHIEIPASESQPSPLDPSPINHPPNGLKPLRLSTVPDAQQFSRSNSQSRISSSSFKSVHSYQQFGTTSRKSQSSSSVSSNHSVSNNPLLSSARSSPIPLHIRNSLVRRESRTPSPLSPQFFKNRTNLEEPPRSAPVISWRESINYSRPSSRISERYSNKDEEYEDENDVFSHNDPCGETTRKLIPVVPYTAPLHQPMYAIDTPKPTLMFAIASDDVDQVREALESGGANPNENYGPQSALEFALTNNKLSNKLEIVKTLLAYGADATVAKTVSLSAPSGQEQVDSQDSEPEDKQASRTLMDELDPATRYYLERADAVHTRRISVLIQRSFFRPLTRVRYDLIGQDRALEQLFRVLSMHSRNLAVTPMVVMLCGPSGHGKSLLARKFGSLLDVPTHTVNMTTLRSTHDLWQSYSMSPYETPTTCTLAEFLINNEGKRCVVVLDEIEKTVDQNALWSLLMPWELGRCSFEAGSRHVDVRNVIWLGTSNIGHDLVFQHRDSRTDPDELMTREEYVELMALLRPRVSEKLGASVLSRITTVLPFVPFSFEEKKAICSEALYSLGGDVARSFSPETVGVLIETALASYCATEGARSLSRAISNQLVDII